MTYRNIILFLISFVLYSLLQVMILKDIVLFDKAFVFVYIAFLLLLPFETSPIALMLLGLVLGTIIDVFYDTLGMHAAACVLLGFLRPYWIRTITPQGGYESGASPRLSIMGFQWFAGYALLLIVIHHFALFFIEAGGFNMFFFTFTKVLFSSLFTFILIVIIQYLVYRRSRSL